MDEPQRDIDPAWPTMGIDIGGTHLDVAWNDGGQGLTLPHTANGLKRLAVALAARPARLVVVEATGGLQRRVVRALDGAGWPVAVVNPRQVRAFAQAAGVLAKTDRRDAQVLADYGARMTPVAKPAPDAAAEALAETVRRRRQVLTMIAEEEARLTRLETPELRQIVVAHVAYLRAELDLLDAALTAQVADDPDRRERAEVLRSAPGVGPVVATTLLALLPELGSANRRQIASLAGLAPHARESGARTGDRHVHGGRREVAAVLYLATLSACRYMPDLAAMLARLRAAGKSPKEARVACARKLLTILNAMVRDRQPWRTPAPHPA